MASTIEAQAFQFEMRPDTSKSQRGASNKFNKTLTGFNTNNSDNQGQQIQGYQNGVGYSDNVVSQKGMMNITGFNFRQNKHQEQKNGESNPQQKTPKQSILIQQNQQFSSTSQGFYQNKRQNSFSKGITLEQYFQNARDYETQPQEEGEGQVGQQGNQKNNETNTPSRVKFPQSFQLSDIKILDDDLKEKNFGRQKSDKLENQPTNKRSSLSNFEKNNQDYSENMIEEQYNTDEFEIHEESGEEEEEDDEENKKRKKKKLMGQINNSSPKKQAKKVGDNKSNRVNSGSPLRSGEKKYRDENSEYQNEDFDDPPSDQEQEEQQEEKDNKQDQKKVLKQKQSLKGEDQGKQQKENDVNSSNKSSQKLGSVENIKIPISNEDQIQKKIRDKYFKKTLHKPFVTQQIVQTNSNNKKGNYNTPNSHTIASTSLASTVGSSNTSSNNNSLLFNNQQSNSNQNQVGAAANNIKINSPLTQSGQTNMSSSNFISVNNNNPSSQQQVAYNCIANMSSIHTKISAPYQPSSTGHNFYSQNHQNGSAANNGAAPSNNNNNNNSPNTYLYAAANTANRKANRSQSPLHAFKRQSNLGHSQQRRLSKEVVEPNSPVEDNQVMRTTFNNTTKKFKIQQPNNSILNNYDTANGNSQFENHIAFRNSFYNKGPPLNSFPNSNFVNGGANGQNNNNSKQRLTINDFYKNQSKYDCYDQSGRNGGGFHNQNNGDYLADVMMMRRTAKENKFLNQKDKIQEMAKEDANYITKHAARFNINPSELVQIKQKN